MFGLIRSYFKLKAVRTNKAFSNNALYLSIDEPYAVEILNALATTNSQIKHVVITTDKPQSKYSKDPIYSFQNKALIQALQKNQQLQTLKIVGCHFNRHAATLFQEGFAASTSLKQFELTRCYLDPIAGYVLSEAVTSLSNLNRLILRHCNFNNKTSLLDALTQTTNLTVLDLSKNNWPSLPIEESDQLIQTLATNSNLKVINLEEVNFLDENFSSKLTHVLQNKSITKLYLKRSSFTTQDMIETNKILEAQTQLQEVSFGTSHVSFGLNLAALNSALNTIKTHKTIKKATFSYFSLDYLATKLADIIHENNALQEVTLESSSLFFKKDKTIDLEPLATALENNITILCINCTYHQNSSQRFLHSITEKTRDKKTAQKIEKLLARNRLLFAITQNSKQLPGLLETASPVLFDELFFLNLLRSLTTADLIQHDATLVKFMLKPAGMWERLKWKIGISNGNAERLSNILEKLIDSAENGNEMDFKLLQQLHNTPAFLNILGSEQWAQIFKDIAQKQPQFSRQAYFIQNHLAFIHQQDTPEANILMQSSFVDPDSSILFLYNAARNSNKSTPANASEIHTASDAIKASAYSQVALDQAFQDCAALEPARAEYFNRYQQFLDKYQVINISELTEAEYNTYKQEEDWLFAQRQLFGPLLTNLIEKLDEHAIKKKTAQQHLNALSS